ncbi:MAG TPA: sulfite exporter TauE/SafE family protein [Verrucomicrobiota bacterium]|nr:sulfite exporter TauE/SafE family protein [Verrucomicrobiota bacterium]
MNTTLLIAFFVVLLISGVFSMFGKGGGSLYTPVLVMLGMAVGPAISTALFLNLVTSLVATIVFQRNKLVDYRFCLVFLPGTVAGSFLGAVLSSMAPRNLLLGIFSVFLYVVGLLMVFSAKEKPGQQVKKLTGKMIALVTVFAFGVGVLSSLIGVGGGLIIFPFLVLYMKYGAQMAAGANSLIVTVSSFVGTIGHFALGHVDWQFLAVTTVACVLGSAVGSHVTVKASPGFVKIAFAGIMWFFATQIALKLAGIV